MLRKKLTARHRGSRRLLTALFFFVLLIPTGQLAFACQAMSQELRSVCCCAEEAAAACEVGSRCDAHIAGQQRGCCEVSLQPIHGIVALPNDAVPAPSSPKPPVAGIPVSPYLALHVARTGAVERSLNPVARSGRMIYLTTGRLRI